MHVSGMSIGYLISQMAHWILEVRHYDWIMCVCVGIERVRLIEELSVALIYALESSAALPMSTHIGRICSSINYINV